MCVDCPKDRPYFDGEKCSACATGTYWDVTKLKCVSCSSGRIFNQ